MSLRSSPVRIWLPHGFTFGGPMPLDLLSWQFWSPSVHQRVVMVTGAGRGIGRAVCRRFGQAGAVVIALARSQEQLDQTKQLVESDGGRCALLTCDVTATDQLEQAIVESSRRFGRLDVLINNAGVAVLAPAVDLAGADFEKLLRVNVAAIFYACKFVWPIMVGQGGGTIINISSVAADDPFPGLGTYGASKAWGNAFTKGLAAEGKEAGIHVFSVGPGAVETDMLRSSFPDYPADECLAPADVAQTVFELTQPAMAHATGQTIYVRK